MLLLLSVGRGWRWWWDPSVFSLLLKLPDHLAGQVATRGPTVRAITTLSTLIIRLGRAMALAVSNSNNKIKKKFGFVSAFNPFFHLKLLFSK